MSSLLPPGDVMHCGLNDWPVDSDLVIDMETLPDPLEASMGETWCHRKACHEYIAKRKNDSDEEALDG
jgi:RNase adaptor protein for sRNA GlmZ degradation